MIRNIPLITKNLLIINLIAFLAMLGLRGWGIDLNDVLGLHFFLAGNFTCTSSLPICLCTEVGSTSSLICSPYGCSARLSNTDGEPNVSCFFTFSVVSELVCCRKWRSSGASI